MVVEKVTIVIHPIQSSPGDTDQDMSDSDDEKEEMSESEESDDLMTLYQFQHYLRKESFAQNVPQAPVATQKKK